MKFGQRIRRAEAASLTNRGSIELADQYFDYKALKKVLKQPEEKSSGRSAFVAKAFLEMDRLSAFFASQAAWVDKYTEQTVRPHASKLGLVLAPVDDAPAGPENCDDSAECTALLDRVEGLAATHAATEFGPLLAEMAHLTRKVQALRRFALINTLGVIKITKKHDKHSTHPVTREVSARLYQTPFSRTPRLQALERALASLAGAAEGRLEGSGSKPGPSSRKSSESSTGGGGRHSRSGTPHPPVRNARSLSGTPHPPALSSGGTPQTTHTAAPSVSGTGRAAVLAPIASLLREPVGSKRPRSATPEPRRRSGASPAADGSARGGSSRGGASGGGSSASPLDFDEDDEDEELQDDGSGWASGGAGKHARMAGLEALADLVAREEAMSTWVAVPPRSSPAAASEVGSTGRKKSKSASPPAVAAAKAGWATATGAEAVSVRPRVRRRKEGDGNKQALGGKPQEGTERDPGEDLPVKLTREALQVHFNLPLNDAARALGICATSVKKACRVFGIAKWPFGKLKQVLRRLAELEELAREESRKAGKVSAEVAGEIGELKAKQASLLEGCFAH